MNHPPSNERTYTSRQWRELRNYATGLQTEIERLRAALGMLYDKWENGDPCYEEGSNGSSLGNAFKLSGAEEAEILALIPSVALAVLSGDSSAPGVFCPKCGNEGPPCACPVETTARDHGEPVPRAMSFEQLLVDAARYRWLRGHLGAGFAVKQANGDPLGFAGSTLLDEALDAARELSQETTCDCPPDCQGPDNTSKECRAENGKGDV